MKSEQVFLCDKGELVGCAKLLLSDTGIPNEVIHGHNLKQFAREGERLVAIYNVQVFQEYEDHHYPYNYRSFEEPPVTLGDINKLDIAFKTVIAWDINKTIENKSTFTPALGNLPQEISVRCLEQHGVHKDTLIRIHGMDNVDREMDDVANGMGLDTSGMFPDDDEMGSDVDEMNSDAVEGNLNAHEMNADSFKSVDTVPGVASGESESGESESGDRPRGYSSSVFIGSNTKRPSRVPLGRLGVNLEIKRRPYRYNTRPKAGPRPICKLEQKRDHLYRLSFESSPFETLRSCCNNACFHFVNPEYALIQYRRILRMSRCQKKRALTAMYDHALGHFRFDGQQVCSRFLSVGFHFSFCLQSSVKGTPKARASASVKACPRETRRDTKKDLIIQFLRDLARNIGDSMPTRSHTNLPLMDKTQVYARYVQTFGDKDRADLASKSYFDWVWKKFCPDLKTHRHHGFTVCEECEYLRSEMSVCTDEEKQAILRAKMNVHYQHMHEERLGYASRRDLAIRSPDKYCSIIVDGADQKSYGLPHFVFNTKGEKGHKLKVKCVGVLEHGPQKHLSLLVLTEEFESGANHVLEAAHRVLDEKKRKCGVLPEVLFVQADNCTRENKNRYFMAYFEMLVAQGVFKEVQVSFLPIGHTHADIDQAFSSVANRLRMNDAMHMEGLLQELRNCYNPRASAEEVTKVANFSGLCDNSGCLVNVPSFSQYRYFRFTRKVSKTKTRGRGAPGGSRDHQTIEDGQVFPTTCDVKYQNWEEWAPMDNAADRNGFLKFVPKLADTPATDTTPPDNVLEINKHLRSVEARLKTAENLEILEAMRDRVYTRRIEDFHWDLESVFELNGDYKDAESNSNTDRTACEELDVQKLRYNLNSFLAVKTDADCSDLFWIARTLRMEKLDDDGNAVELKVRWYQAKDGSGDAFSSSYEMSTYLEGSDRKLFDDVIDVRTILCEFDALTRAGRLHVRTQKAIRQTLNMN